MTTTKRGIFNKQKEKKENFKTKETRILIQKTKCLIVELFIESQTGCINLHLHDLFSVVFNLANLK